jgi:hypothetical protein
MRSIEQTIAPNLRGRLGADADLYVLAKPRHVDYITKRISGLLQREVRLAILAL